MDELVNGTFKPEAIAYIQQTIERLRRPGPTPRPSAVLRSPDDRRHDLLYAMVLDNDFNEPGGYLGNVGSGKTWACRKKLGLPSPEAEPATF